MALPQFEYTTGRSHLPSTEPGRLGKLEYNGCLFSPLFSTNVSGIMVKDNAQRTVKYTEYTISADGYVTLPGGAVDINPAMTRLRLLLTAQAGALIYQGRGMDLIINAGANSILDVAWGPTPEVLDFQPLGGGRGAFVKWQVKVRVADVRRIRIVRNQAGQPVVVGGLARIPLLQLNYDTSVGYNEDGYSTLSIKGTLEIPMTRSPNQAARGLKHTVDDVRDILRHRIFANIDLSRFRVTRRDFNISRDKRTMEWSVMAEEKPYMDLPPNCTVARGTFSVRPAKVGAGLATWLCTMRATYTVRADRPRREAWIAFLTLLRLRMNEERNANVPRARAAPQNNVRELNFIDRIIIQIAIARGDFAVVEGIRAQHEAANRGINRQQQARVNRGRPLLIDFSFDEGLYLDSKNVTFSATWRLVTTFSHIMIASGLWRKLPEKLAKGRDNNAWAVSVKDIMGPESWLSNRLDPRADIIVDFGSD